MSEQIEETKSIDAAPHTTTRKPRPQGVVLTEPQVESAIDELVDNSYVEKFPRLDRFYADPIYNNQVFCMHSFVPAKGASPDENGLYGFMKCRGTFQMLEEANQRAEWIIRNCDSSHSLHTTYVGRPFPIAKDNKKYVKETVEIDLKKKTIETHSDFLRDQKDEEKREIMEIKEREKKLVEESKEDFVQDPLDRYIELNVKRANLTWAYLEAQKKIADMKQSILKSREEISDMDTEHPSFRGDFMERYLEARRQSGFPDVDTNAENNFIKYLVEDADLGF